MSDARHARQGRRSTKTLVTFRPAEQPMPTVFLHAGLHKTGTTSIQMVFTAARADLLRKWSFLYPEQGCPPNAKYGQHELAWSVIRRPSYLPPAWIDRQPSQHVWHQLRSEIEGSRANAVLISSEEFDCLNAQEIGEVGRLLEGYEIVPVIYFRRHPELIDSLYGTAQQDGYSETIEYLSRVCRTRFDYQQMVADWSSIARDRRVFAFSYENHEDVVSHLAANIGVGQEALRLPRQRFNSSDGASHMTAALRLEIEANHARDIEFWSQLD